MSELPTAAGGISINLNIPEGDLIVSSNGPTTLMNTIEDPSSMGLMNRVSVWDYFFKTLARKSYKFKSLTIEDRPKITAYYNRHRSPHNVRCSIKMSETTASEDLQNLLTDLNEIGFDKPDRVISFFVRVNLQFNSYTMLGEAYFIDILYSEKNSTLNLIKTLTVPFTGSEGLMSTTDYYEDTSKEALLVLEEELTGIIETL